MAAPSDWSDREHPDVLCLFDVDGTLTPARRVRRMAPTNRERTDSPHHQASRVWTTSQFVEPEMLETLRQVRRKVVIGFVGGSDLAKQKEQLGENGTGATLSRTARLLCSTPTAHNGAAHTTPTVLDLFDFGFAENGLTAYRKGKVLATQVRQPFRMARRLGAPLTDFSTGPLAVAAHAELHRLDRRGAVPAVGQLHPHLHCQPQDPQEAVRTRRRFATSGRAP